MDFSDTPSPQLSFTELQIIFPNPIQRFPSSQELLNIYKGSCFLFNLIPDKFSVYREFILQNWSENSISLETPININDNPVNTQKLIRIIPVMEKIFYTHANCFDIITIFRKKLSDIFSMTNSIVTNNDAQLLIDFKKIFPYSFKHYVPVLEFLDLYNCIFTLYNLKINCRRDIILTTLHSYPNDFLSSDWELKIARLFYLMESSFPESSRREQIIDSFRHSFCGIFFHQKYSL